MKKLVFVFLVMIFTGRVFAQEHYIVIYKTINEKKCDTIRVYDYVTVDLMNKKRSYGRISEIASNYFIIGNDTVEPENVSRVYFSRHHPAKAGKIIIGSGLIILGTGIAIITTAILTDVNTVDFGLALGGLASAVVGPVVCIVGAIVHKKETKGKRMIGRKWGLKIV